MKRLKNKLGFTLIEFLLVLAILCILSMIGYDQWVEYSGSMKYIIG